MSEFSFDRAKADYQPDYGRFLLHSKNYVKQYNQTYLKRLQLMIDPVRTQVVRRWGESAPILNKIIDIENESYRTQECVLIGMLFKDLKLRGSILDDFKDGTGITSSLISFNNLASDKDAMILEDHSGRVALGGVMKAITANLVSGVILAVKGSIDEFGEFVVVDYLFSYKVTPIERSIPKLSIESASPEGKFVAFVSGLAIGSSHADEVDDIAIQLFVDFVLGKYGDENLARIASRITRVIVAGDSVVASEAAGSKERFASQSKSTTKSSLANPSKQLDLWLSQLLGSCQVDILPGLSDPANISLPQQPFHPCIFPHSVRFNTFERVPNPTQAFIDGVRIVGHSGQPVSDIARQTYARSTDDSAMELVTAPEEEEVVLDTAESGIDADETIIELEAKPMKIKSDVADGGERRLEILRQTLEWGHLAPTVPDTMPCYPFSDIDPFILDSANVPQILFAGNQPSFASEVVEITDADQIHHQTRLICIPRFRETGIIVLCDISQEDYPCYLVRFK